MKNGSILFGGILLAILALSSCNKKTEPAVIKKIYEVKTQTLFHFVETNGSVQSLNEIGIQAPVRGRLDKLYVKEGESVFKGQKIAQMSSSQRAEMLDMAQNKGPKELAYWKKQLLPIFIYAPATGKIIDLKAKPLDNIGGTFARLSLGDIVIANIDEIDLPKIKLNQDVNVEFDINPGKDFSGKLIRISQFSKKVSNVNVYEIEVALDEKAIDKTTFKPRIGMSVTLKIPIRIVENALYLPTEAVSGYSNKKVDLILNSGGKKTVQLGNIYQDKVHIVSGLNENDKIVVMIRNLKKKKTRFKSPFTLLKKK